MARVIKAGATVVPRGLADAKAEASRLLEEAHEQARALVQAARDEAGALRDRAREEGRAEAAAAAADAVLAAARARDAMLARAEGDVVEVAVAAAAKIVEAHVAVGPEQVLALVRGTLERARRARQVTLYLHPDDAASLAAGGEALPPNVQIEPDASLSRGDCVVKSELGTIDARVTVKLAAVKGALLGQP